MNNMKKPFIILLLAFVSPKFMTAQSVGIGISNPDNSAMLHINSTIKGLLIPSMTSTQRNAIATPAEGLIVYDLTVKRLYYYQNGTWRFFLDNQYWAASTTRNWVYNGTDSVGIGTAAPNERLHVNGNIRASGDVKVTGNVGAGVSTPEQQLHVRTTSSGEGILVDAVNPIIQFRQSNTPNPGYSNTGFIQASGDNIRIGTNSGNTDGSFVIRNNGSDRVFVNAAGNMGVGVSSPASKLDVSGNVNITGKLTNTNATGTFNLLPLCYGRVAFNATSFTGTPGVSVAKIQTGVYEISHAGFTSTTTIVVTMNQYVGGTYSYPNVENWTASGPNVYRITFYNTSLGEPRDAGFSFIAYQ